MSGAPYVGADIVLKMDLRDFFSRTTLDRVRAYFVKIGWGGDAADLLVRLTTYQQGLPQGAPTSPRLSNLVNYGLDSRLFALGLTLGAMYTRYADDITFSFTLDGYTGRVRTQNPKTLERLVQAVAPENERAVIASLIHTTKRIVKDDGYVLHQDKKLRICRRHERMLVTGLVVNERLNLPRHTRRKLRAVEHHLKTGRPATLNQAQLDGWKALQAMVVRGQSE